jgi:hypothetical protein
VTFNWENYYYPPPHPDGWDPDLYGPNWHATESIFTYYRRPIGTDSVTKYKHDLWRKPLVGLVDPQAVDLADIVRAECLRSDNDITEDDIDVTELEGIPVRGFIAQGSAREAIEDLMGIFAFYAVCSDKLYFRLLDAAAVDSIANAETGAGVDQAGDPFTGLERGNDLEVPSDVTVVGPNPSADGDPGAETSDRLVTAGRKKQSVQTLVVLTPEERKGRANAFALDARTALHTARLAFDDTHAKLEPGDVTTVYDEEGNGYNVRITRETYAQGVHDAEIRLFDRADLVTTGTTSDTYTPVINIVPTVGTDLVLLDTGLLRDADDGAHLLAAVKPSASGRWPGASIYRSVDDATFAAVASTATRAVIGVASTALGDFHRWVWDETSTVTVDVGDATLTASTKAAMQADASINVAAIGADGRWEIVRFRTPSLVSPGVYILSGFLRGLRGTESFRGTHAAGDTFVLLSSATLKRIAVSNVDIGLDRYWKAVTVGKQVSAVASSLLSPDAVAMKPWAPCDLRIERDGSNNASITWHGRSRLAVRLGGIGGSYVPPDSTLVGYRLRILSGVTVVRTEDVTDPSYDYSAADQTSDGLTPGDPISVEVAPVSALVGEGYELEGTA